MYSSFARGRAALCVVQRIRVLMTVASHGWLGRVLINNGEMSFLLSTTTSTTLSREYVFFYVWRREKKTPSRPRQRKKHHQGCTYYSGRLTPSENALRSSSSLSPRMHPSLCGHVRCSNLHHDNNP